MQATMNPSPLDQCLRISAAHAHIALVLDDALGTFHGLSYADFRLLHQLAQAPDQRLPLVELAPRLGLGPSAALRQILPLEKTGLVERDVHADNKHQRDVHLRAAGRQIVSGAIETAQSLCEQLAPAIAIDKVVFGSDRPD